MVEPLCQSLTDLGFDLNTEPGLSFKSRRQAGVPEYGMPSLPDSHEVYFNHASLGDFILILKGAF